MLFAPIFLLFFPLWAQCDAMAALELYQANGDLDFLKEIFPALVDYYDYLTRRRADSDGLIRIIHPWESGWDNSQRWDEAIGLGRQTGTVERSSIDDRKMALFSKWKALNWNLEAIFTSGDFSVKPVDFNVLYVKNLECLAVLAEQLQENSQLGGCSISQLSGTYGKGARWPTSDLVTVSWELVPSTSVQVGQ